jgi:hypothetical protein
VNSKRCNFQTTRNYVAVYLLQICLAVLAIIRLLRGVTYGNDATVPPPTTDASAPPPAYAASVYGADPRFSPQPFSIRPGENVQATTEQPAY